MKIIRYENQQSRRFGNGNSLLAPSFLDHLFSEWGEAPLRQRQPNASLREEGTSYCLRIELPGIKKESIALELTDGRLTVRTDESGSGKGQEAAYCESFSVSVPRGISHKRVSAQYEDGVLSVKLPKSESARTHKISIG